MGLITNTENWFLGVCVKRGVTGAVVALSGYVGTHAIGKLLEKYGVHVDWTTFQAEAIVGLCGLIAMLHDYLKVKKGLTWL